MGYSISKHRSGAPLRGVLRTYVACVAGIALLALTAPPAASETIRQREFQPINPEIIGQGGSFVAVAEGYGALFTNPAGLSRTVDPEWTLPSLSFWVHSRPDLLLPTIGALGGQDVSADSTGESQTRDELILNTLSEQFTTNGFGIGTGLGFGYVGNRLGIGVNVALDSYLYGDTFPLGLEGELTSQFSLVFGYAYPFDIGPVRLSVGGALRPNLRITSLVGSDTAADLLTEFTGVNTGEENGGGSLTDSITALNGWGVAFDAGLMASYRAFSLGLQARDLLNTNMQYSRNSLQQILDALSAGGLPSAPEEGDPEYVSDTYIIPTAVSLGAAWQPDLGATAFLVDPELHFEIDDVLGTAQLNPDRPTSVWTRLHVGTEISLLRFFDFRMGINQGYFTMGAGLDLLFLNLQFALYSQEFGRYPGDQQVGGAALEFAVRF